MQTTLLGRKALNNNKKRPFKNPLRQAGQSLDERINYLINEKIGYHGAAICVFLVLALMAWHEWYFQHPLKPYAMTAISAMVVTYSITKIYNFKREIKRLKLARDGERLVGQSLETLRENGCSVFHDIIGGNFNVDHIVIGQQGVFTIETKTRSKPLKGRADIQYDGTKITVNGFSPDRDPIAQAKAQAHWLKDLLRDLTGRNLKVRPVVLFPGWFISRQPKGAQVWVLNEKAFPHFLKNEPSLLAPEEVHAIAGHIARFTRQGMSDVGFNLGGVKIWFLY
jgi:hypothetical protein